MADIETRPLAPIPSFWSATSRVRIRTLALLRWLAIGGQTVAVLFVRYILNVEFPLEWALAAIGISIAVNLVLTRRSQELARLVIPEGRRLSFIRIDHRALHSLDRVVGHGVAITQVLEQGRQGRQAVPDR